MTTLHVQQAELEAAVARFPTVAGVKTDSDFPHGLSIKVIERPPALIVTDGESDSAVAADGEVLPGVDAQSDQLPTLQVDKLPSSGSLSGEDLQEALVAGAAPAPLAPLIEKIAYQDEEGVTLTVKGGIELRFGDSAKATDKWAAVAAVLADPRLDTLTYVDVRVPKRPAVGGTGEGATATPPDTVTTPTT
jgi:cell division protein FtsQ